MGFVVSFGSRDFLGQVVVEPCTVGEGELQGASARYVHKGRPFDCFEGIRSFESFVDLSEVLEGTREAFGGEGAIENLFGLYRLFASPVDFEGFRDFGYHGTDGQNIGVDEHHGRFGEVVFVADVASADDGGAAVCDEGLVVHPFAQGFDIENQGDVAQEAPPGIGIEDLHFDAGMAGDHRPVRVFVGRGQVVEKQAYLHASVGRLEEMVEKIVTDPVVFEDIVLDI